MEWLTFVGRLSLICWSVYLFHFVLPFRYAGFPAQLPLDRLRPRVVHYPGGAHRVVLVSVRELFQTWEQICFYFLLTNRVIDRGI